MDGSKAGALILPASKEGALDVAFLVVQLDITERDEKVEEMDSFDAFLLI